MKKTTKIDTTIEVTLEAQDVVLWAKHLNVVPEGWVFYSTQVLGADTSKGATLILRRQEIEVPK